MMDMVKQAVGPAAKGAVDAATKGAE